MDRPYIFCHMLTSLDGKIMGNYMTTPEGNGLHGSFTTSPSASGPTIDIRDGCRGVSPRTTTSRFTRSPRWTRMPRQYLKAISWPGGATCTTCR